ncbi:hypothetical protein [Roseibium sp.]|uniref:hypothetical protein n=1 Tax=Roseibium sp. TaxID=1936156 RepID=UPI0032994D10
MIDTAHTLAPFALTMIAALCLLIVFINLRARQLDHTARKSFGQWPETKETHTPHSTNARVPLLPDVPARRVATGLAVFIPVGETLFLLAQGGPS